MITITQAIPLNRLVHSRTNVRRTGRSKGVEALVASITAHGLLQGLNVRPTSGNRFEVVAGGRRLEALKALVKDGKLDRDTTIPCVVLSDQDNAAEISLAENAIREAMHPDDQCTAFLQLVEDGQSPEDVAARFGVTPAVVRQRLKLASVSPLLRKRFRAGELDLAQMMALALVDDHAAQEAVWDSLPDWNKEPDAIRRALTTEGLTANHRLALFVGIEAYEAAGGTVLRDLFDDEQSPVLADAALVEQLAMRKLEEEACYVKAEGWQWVSVALKADYTTNYGRVYPSMADDSQDEVYSAVDLARAGARVIVSYNGTATIERGLIDPATVKVERRAEQMKAGTVPEALSLPDTLVEDLTGHRTAALRLELARNPAVALAAIVHGLGLRLLYQAYGAASCLDISARSEALESYVKSKSECTSHSAMSEIVSGWRETLPTDPARFWDWCIVQDQPTLLTLMGVLAGMSVDAVQRKGAGNKALLRHADRLAESLALDMHQHWTPEANGFFARLSKGLMVQTLITNDEPQQAAVIGKLKKPEAAQRTATALLAKGWLPAPLLIGAIADDHDQSWARDADAEHDDDDQRDDDGDEA